MTAELAVSNDPTLAAIGQGAAGALVQPAADLDDIAKAFTAYQHLSQSLLVESDYQSISGKRFPKRSAWRKLAVAYGVTFEIVERHIDRDGRDVVFAEFVVRATAPNGRFADGWGACDLYEKCCPGPARCTIRAERHQHCQADCPGTVHYSHHNHDVPATASTRAINRAAADLFGLGEVSAEEVGTLEVRGEHDRLMAEVDYLIGELQQAGLDVDEAKVRRHAQVRRDYAEQAVRVLRQRLDGYQDRAGDMDGGGQ